MSIRVLEQQEIRLRSIRLQLEMATEILIGILDAMDGDTDLEPSLGYHGPGVDEPWNDAEGDQCDDEGDQSDTGIGDTDGLMEQVVAVNGGLLAGYGASGFAKFVE